MFNLKKLHTIMSPTNKKTFLIPVIDKITWQMKQEYGKKGKKMVKTGEYEDGIWQNYCKDEHFSLNSLRHEFRNLSPQGSLPL